MERAKGFCMEQVFFWNSAKLEQAFLWKYALSEYTADTVSKQA